MVGSTMVLYLMSLTVVSVTCTYPLYVLLFVPFWWGCWLWVIFWPRCLWWRIRTSLKSVSCGSFLETLDQQEHQTVKNIKSLLKKSSCMAFILKLKRSIAFSLACFPVRQNETQFPDRHMWQKIVSAHRATDTILLQPIVVLLVLFPTLPQ